MTDIKPLSRGWKPIARDWCRQIARETPDGPVTGPDGQFLAALLTRHPDATQKIGRPLVSWHETAWQRYHQHHARLQILSVAAHLEITRERRQR